MEALTQIAYSVQLADGETPDFDALAYDVAFTNCERVVARGKGTNDWVEIHDSSENDVLIARTHKVEMMNGVRVGYERGAAYRITVRGYQHVTAIADQGGTRDFAKLYDSSESGVDVWAAAYVDGKTWSSMTSPTRLLYEAIGFEYVGRLRVQQRAREQSRHQREGDCRGCGFRLSVRLVGGRSGVAPGIRQPSNHPRRTRDLVTD